MPFHSTKPIFSTKLEATQPSFNPVRHKMKYFWVHFSFQTLKFSSDVLEEMNNKRRSIVGGLAIASGTDTSQPQQSKKEQFENLEQVRSKVKKGMVNIGGALPPANSVTK